MFGINLATKPARLRGRRWMEIRAFIFATEKYCRVCRRLGYQVLAVELDHVVALERGGNDEPENLQPLCHECHAAKTAGKRTIGLDGWPVR